MLKDRNLYNDLYSCGNLRDMIRWQKALKPDFSIEVGSFDATFSFKLDSLFGPLPKVKKTFRFASLLKLFAESN